MESKILPSIVTTQTFKGANLTDESRTVAVEFDDSQGRTVFVIVPSDQALDLGTQMMVEAAKAAKLRKRPEG